MISATVSRGTKPRLTELVECKLEGLSGWASKTHGPKPQTKQTTYRLWQTSKTTTLKLGADRVLHSLSRFWVEGCGNKLEPTKAPSRQSYNIHISHHIIWSRRLIYSPYMSICICGLPTLVFLQFAYHRNLPSHRCPVGQRVGSNWAVPAPGPRSGSSSMRISTPSTCSESLRPRRGLIHTGRVEESKWTRRTLTP